MKKIALVFTLASYLLTGCNELDAPYIRVERFERAEHYKPITLKIEEGDILYRNGIEVMVFDEVETGYYTISSGGYFELLRKNKHYKG